jgi:sterol desaturase/sphingolipid hydroxylase (fatty acid hydroxylase superfamily)
MFELLGWITLALIPGFLLLDFVWQSRRYGKTRHWRLRGLLVTVAIFFFTGEVALWWGNLLGDFHLIDGSGLGIWGGAIVGIVVYELLHYWYHRLAHQWNWLWFAGHQMHHSAESLDAFGAYYLHPFDAFMFTTLGSLVFFPLLGLVPEAGVIGALFLTFNAMFQHANIKTPHWLGYVIQRPESHGIHHANGVHRYNYSDLPVWDMVFGTYRNPTRDEVPTEAGFYKGASNRILAMLLGRDVSKPKAGNDKLAEELAQRNIATQLGYSSE